MSAPVVIKNAVDVWTDESSGKARRHTIRLQLRAGTNAKRYGWIFFNRAWSEDAKIISAKLRLWNGDDWSTSTTLTVFLAALKWDLDKIVWGNQPGTTGTSKTLNKASASPNTMWEIDVTTLLDTAVLAGDWFGFRVSTNRTTKGWLHSSQSPRGRFRPQLIVEWIDPPDEPDQLTPSGGLSVSKQKATLVYDYNDPMGDFSLSAHQLQFGSSQANLDAGTTTYDSGEVPTTIPEFDTTLAAYSAWAGLADGAGTWWRCRAKDATSGEWSGWAESVEFYRNTKGVLTITGDIAASIKEGSPTATWTFTGRTQESYQVAVAYADSPDDWIWDSGIITSTANSHPIPFGVITDATEQYVVTVRVWDTIDRIATPGDSTHVEAQTGPLSVTYDGTVTNITGLGMASDPLLPIAILSFSRTTTPDFFQVLRSEDGVNWEYVIEELGTDALVSGSNYEIKDMAAPSYKQSYWKVVPVQGGKQGNGLVVSGSVRRLAPFLYRPDGTDACCFLNPKRSRKFLDVQELHEPLSGDAVLVTQRLGKASGWVSGRLTGDALAGVSADEMLARFKRLRRDSGQEMLIATANETHRGVAFNFNYEPVTDMSGVTYEAEFEWVEV